MCGIAGLIHCGDSVILEKMTEVLAHRGPDDAGIQWFPEQGSGLGHRRLSIIDLSASGHQPMCNEKKNLWITYNGEIYNYQEVRGVLEERGCRFFSRSDTEVVLKAYEEWGAACLHRLNGMFAFGIFHVESGDLFCARDRLGIKPFYYAHKGEAFLFASEIKAILTSGLTVREPDWAALVNPTRFQVSPKTGFSGINKLPPGHYLLFKDGILKIRPYWQLEAYESNGLEEREAVGELETLLQDAVRLQMTADVPVGAFLSGGLDSSIITALMTGLTDKPVSTFTIRFSEKDQKFEKMPRDDRYARKVAAYFGTRHHEYEIRPDIVSLLPRMVYHLDEPLADPAALNTYLISRHARENGIVVLLNGMGGDEIFGGYRKQLACAAAETYQRVFPKWLRRGIEAGAERIPTAGSNGASRNMRWAKRFLSFASLPPFERFLSSDLSLDPSQFKGLYNAKIPYEDTHFYKAQRENFEQGGISYLTRMCLNDTKVFLPEHNLTYSDKACMAAGVESRPPLADHRIVEYMFKLGPEYRIRKLTQKYLLKKVSEKYLPKEIVYRPKAPFGAPLRAWIRKDLAEMVDDYLSRSSLRERGIYNEDYVARKVKEDRNGLSDQSLLIWQLLTNEIWFRTFFDGEMAQCSN